MNIHSYNKLFVLLLVFCIGACMNAYQGRPNQHAELESHLKRGKMLQEQGLFEEATGEYQKAIASDAKSDEAHFLLGYVLWLQYLDSYKTASDKYLHEALVVDQKVPMPKISEKEEKRVLTKHGLRFDYAAKSIKAYARAVELNPDHWQARYHVASNHLRNKRYKKAIEQYKEVLRVNPRHDSSYGGLGSAHHATGNHELAIKNYKKSIELSGKIMMTNLRLGQAYIETGQKLKAIEILKEMKAQDSILYDSLYGLIYGHFDDR